MTSKLDVYKTPANMNDGEWIEAESGLRVRCLLITSWNRAYQREIMKTLNEGENRFEVMVDAFNRICILEIEGEDVELPLDYDTYMALVQELFVKAQNLGEAAQVTHGEAVKKLTAT